MTTKKTWTWRIRNYLAPLALGTALSFSAGCSSKEEASLPVSSEVRALIQRESEEEERAKQESLEREYNTRLESAFELFNDSIKDRYFSRTEQSEEYSSLKELNESFSKLRQYSRDNKEFSDKHQQMISLYSLIWENYNGVDFATTELEKTLRKQGLQVKVECPEEGSLLDSLVCLGLGVPAIVGFCGLINLIRGKERK